jgi:uncharacterized protein YegL
MYDAKWGRAIPGHIIFLIDQSGSMSEGKRAEMTAECVQNSIVEIVRGSIHGEEVRDRAFITVIGYGQKNTPVTIIRQGWVSEWADDVLLAKKNGTCIIPATAEWGTPMAQAFQQAKRCLDEWIAVRDEAHQQKPSESMAAPIVLNITDGEPDNEQDARNAANEILNTPTPDGNVLVFNAHMNDKGTEIVCPTDKSDLKGDKNAEFLFDISSPVTDKMVSVAKAIGIETIANGAMGFVANARQATLARFIEFGSQSQSQHQ